MMDIRNETTAKIPNLNPTKIKGAAIRLKAVKAK
jgi:hypothetical protein